MRVSASLWGRADQHTCFGAFAAATAAMLLLIAATAVVVRAAAAPSPGLASVAV